jgi:signal transduction histidine kinase
MTLSIRARLTLWYSTIVVAVLVAGAIVGSVAQGRLALQRLDDDLNRTLATLEGVMRTEFGEGLTLEAAADEASAEVVAPDRILALLRPDGRVLRVWGLTTEHQVVRSLPQASGRPAHVSPDDATRAVIRLVDHRGHQYVAVVMAPLAPLEAQHAETSRAMWTGVIIALILAAGGGWLIGRQTLRPLTRMAEQASRIDAHHATERLTIPSSGDELGKLAATVNDLLDRLAAALDQQRQFMADASHQLRTPVSVVRTAAQVTLAREARSPDEYRESLAIVREQANRLARVVDALFLLSRAEAHGVPLRREFLSLDELLEDSVRGFRVLAHARGVTLTTGGDQEVGLTGDDNLLRQMIGNLLDNAIRHADPGGRVHSDIVHDDRRVWLRVVNDGAGIPAADHLRIFERFVRIGASEGAGLGLPIARWIAGAHHGSLTLEESRPGRTVFLVTLPADGSPIAGAPQAREAVAT